MGPSARRNATCSDGFLAGNTSPRHHTWFLHCMLQALPRACLKQFDLLVSARCMVPREMAEVLQVPLEEGPVAVQGLPVELRRPRRIMAAHARPNIHCASRSLGRLHRSAGATLPRCLRQCRWSKSHLQVRSQVRSQLTPSTVGCLRSAHNTIGRASSGFDLRPRLLPVQQARRVHRVNVLQDVHEEVLTGHLAAGSRAKSMLLPAPLRRLGRITCPPP